MIYISIVQGVQDDMGSKVETIFKFGRDMFKNPFNMDTKLFLENFIWCFLFGLLLLLNQVASLGFSASYDLRTVKLPWQCSFKPSSNFGNIIASFLILLFLVSEFVFVSRWQRSFILKFLNTAFADQTFTLFNVYEKVFYISDDVFEDIYFAYFDT